MLSLSPLGTSPLLRLWQGENAHYWFTNFWITLYWLGQNLLNAFYFILWDSRGCPALQPRLQCRRKPQALPKAVSRAHPCSAPPVQAGQLKLPGTKEQRLFGSCQAAWGLLAPGSGLPGELYRRKVDRSGRRLRVRVRESDRSTVQAGNYPSYPNSYPKWLFWSTFEWQYKTWPFLFGSKLTGTTS